MDVQIRRGTALHLLSGVLAHAVREGLPRPSRSWLSLRARLAPGRLTRRAKPAHAQASRAFVGDTEQRAGARPKFAAATSRVWSEKRVAMRTATSSWVSLDLQGSFRRRWEGCSLERETAIRRLSAIRALVPADSRWIRVAYRERAGGDSKHGRRAVWRGQPGAGSCRTARGSAMVSRPTDSRAGDVHSRSRASSTSSRAHTSGSRARSGPPPGCSRTTAPVADCSSGGTPITYSAHTQAVTASCRRTR